MRLVSRLEDANQLDPAVAVGQKAARSIRPGRIRDALHGVWLGHPLHPVLVQVPVGAWMSASALDLLVPRADAAARRLVAAGLVASAPAIVAGLTCPWHGSVFRLADGSVARGPATAPQPTFQARVVGETVQVCLPGAG